MLCCVLWWGEGGREGTLFFSDLLFLLVLFVMCEEGDAILVACRKSRRGFLDTS